MTVNIKYTIRVGKTNQIYKFFENRGGYNDMCMRYILLYVVEWFQNYIYILVKRKIKGVVQLYIYMLYTYLELYIDLEKEFKMEIQRLDDQNENIRMKKEGFTYMHVGLLVQLYQEYFQYIGYWSDPLIKFWHFGMAKQVLGENFNSVM